ncbi:MAG: hemolysin family protein [Lachnospiraceae bacterium]|nr:hemolysin family protein [Lachnospiraceae bacterium]
MDKTSIIQLIILIILLMLSAFFSSAETALSAVSAIKIRAMAEEGKRHAKTLEKVVSHYGKMLSTILIGNNIVNISASALATTLTIRLFGDYAIGYATGLLTLAVLLFGEIVPKNAAKIRAEKLSLIYAPIIASLMWLLTPVIWIVDHIASAIMWILRINPHEKAVMTEAELRTFVDVSHEDGIIESDEKTMINNVFDFSDALAKEIMIPNIDMVCVSKTAGYDEVMEVFKGCMYTRLPVYEGERGNIVGLVNIKDFILMEDKKGFKVENIMRNGYYTYEFKKTSDLLMELRQSGLSVAFVLSEYGLCVGMVTLEDLLEEIVGEIRDEYDEEEKESIKKVEKNVYMIEGSRKIDDVNDALGLKLDSEEYDSVAGLILERIDRMPLEGDEVILDNGIKLKVNEVENNRITKVRLSLPANEVKEEVTEA